MEPWQFLRPDHYFFLIVHPRGLFNRKCLEHHQIYMSTQYQYRHILFMELFSACTFEFWPKIIQCKTWCFLSNSHKCFLSFDPSTFSWVEGHPSKLNPTKWFLIRKVEWEMIHDVRKAEAKYLLQVIIMKLLDWHFRWTCFKCWKWQMSWL